MNKFELFSSQFSPRKSRYLLPIVAALLLVLTLISTLIFNSLNRSMYYQTVAEDAADLGLSTAKACLMSGNSSWSENNLSLRPNTGCDGLEIPDRPASFYYTQGSNRVDSTFEVKQVKNSQDASNKIITVVGTAKVVDASGGVINTTSRTIEVTAKPSNTQSGRASREIQEVSTGADAACAVAEYRAYCWGSNKYGQLGIGKSPQNDEQPIPTAVADNASPMAADPGVCGTKDLLGKCSQYIRKPSPALPASALAGKAVTKVSVGKTHTCAVASAAVYCWGDNTYGQLGNRTNVNSFVPVAVATDLSSKDSATLSYPNSCGNLNQQGCQNVLRPSNGLSSKEVIDIIAGDYFSCALSSDGTVACWGRGSNGQLGNNQRSDFNYPQAVYARNASNAERTSPAVCDQQLRGTCTRSSSDPAPAQPVAKDSALYGKQVTSLARVHGSVVCAIDDQQKTYCWGYGMGEGNLPSSRTTPCPSDSPGSSTGYLDALQPREISTPVSMKRIDIAPNNYVTGIGSNNVAYYWGLHGYATSAQKAGSCKVKDSNRHSGTCSGATTGCNRYVTEYSYKISYKYTGYDTPQGPLYSGSIDGGPLNQRRLGVTSGNAFNGLFCGQVGTSLYCDTHETDATKGQTGSNSVKKCVTTGWFIFSKTTCDKIPSGPQAVVMDGWLSKKAISAMDTGASGYTCVIADKQLGCWGVNSSGQLGNGDTASRNVPTAVDISTASAIGKPSVGYTFGSPVVLQ